MAGVIARDRSERPTLANWLRPPWNRWSFRHARELFWSENVPARGPRPLEDARVEAFLDVIPEGYLERSYCDALVVLHEGRLVAEWYGPGVRPDDRHILFSCTKSIVGLVVESLIAEGILDEDAVVSSYVPELTGGGYGSATVRQVLDMTANVAFVEDYDGPDVRAYREAVGQVPAPHSPGIHAFVTGLPQDGDHGRMMKYISTTADVAGWICEKATGRSLAELVSTYVWTPMGAEHDADMLVDRYGAARASGGLCATARDMARVGQLLLDAQGSSTVARAAAAVNQPGDAKCWSAGTLAESGMGDAYRSLWYQMNSEDVITAGGIHGQRIYVDRGHRVVVAQQSSTPVTMDSASWSEAYPTFAAIARCLAK